MLCIHNYRNASAIQLNKSARLHSRKVFERFTRCFVYANMARKEARPRTKLLSLLEARERAEKEITLMINRTFRYIALALTLAAFTSTVQNASAQSSCSDSNSCVVGGGDPEPMGVYQTILIVFATTFLP